MNKNVITDPKVKAISQRVLQAAKDTYKDKLDKVYLFGSYARGDYDAESDIDFLIISDLPQEEVCAKHMEVGDKIPYIDMEYDLLVSCCVTSSKLFNQYIEALPFYRNVAREGIIIND